MARTTALKAGLISAGAGLVLILGAFAVTSTMAGAQTPPSPTPGTEQQQTAPTNPSTPNNGNQAAPPMDHQHQDGDCPGIDGSNSGTEGQRPNRGTAPQDGGTSSGTSFHGMHGGGPRI